MKKTVMILMIASCACTVSAVQSSSIPNDEYTHQVQVDEYTPQAPVDEYVHVENNNLQEYEQHVCDNIKPPKISAAMALLSEVGGRILIECIVLREAVRRYYASLKATIERWLGLTTTQQ
jgi:hypothetical protein